MNRLETVDATHPNWQALALHLPPSECADFMWMYRDRTVHFYKHIITRRYLLLDRDGNCYGQLNGELGVADFAAEYLRVIDTE